MSGPHRRTWSVTPSQLHQREAHYPEWLANPVLVKNNNDKWRVCIDFSNLNEACPKDSFPLPRIDQMVDAMAGHELLSFMDAFTLDTIRSRCIHQTKTRQHSSPIRESTVISDVIQIEECQSYLSTNGQQGLQGADRTHHGGIHRRHACEEFDAPIMCNI